MIEEEKGKKKQLQKKPVKPQKPQGPPAKPGEAPADNVVQLVRLAGVVVSGNLTLPKALKKIKGIGPRVAESLILRLGYPENTKVGVLTEVQIAEIEKKLENINMMLPAWMLNRRKDYATGLDFHKIGPELEFTRREDINREKKIKTYRGVRHILGQPVRGQRTRSSFRTGSTLGVSRKKTTTAQAQAKSADSKGGKEKGK